VWNNWWTSDSQKCDVSVLSFSLFRSKLKHTRTLVFVTCSLVFLFRFKLKHTRTLVFVTCSLVFLFRPKLKHTRTLVFVTCSLVFLFRPKLKEMQSVFTRRLITTALRSKIQNDITASDVVLFMKVTFSLLHNPGNTGSAPMRFLKSSSTDPHSSRNLPILAL
jgi:hypothetical protein